MLFHQIVLILTFILPIFGSKRILLEDIKVLTLYAGKMTASQRGPAVRQLACIGGSAGCDSFRPQVVQCYNRGSDGYQTQWECKTDMDNLYRFGKIEVSCEGYDHSGDHYVLKGSCGLEYTLDFTKEGHKRKEGHQHNYYGDNKNYQYSGYEKHSFGIGDVIVLIIVALVIYAFYRTCLSSSMYQYSTTNTDYPPDSNPGPGGFYGGSYPGSSPPPYGFRQEHYDAGCGTRQQPHNQGSSSGGFWTGATTGGILGYLLGSRSSSRQSHSSYNTHQPSSSWSTYDDNRAFGGSSNSSSDTSGSSGTRTASGFGGTRVR